MVKTEVVYDSQGDYIGKRWKCFCGRGVESYLGHDVDCPCGRLFNSQGQQLQHPALWESDY